jgi:peptidoglycan/xylan/chitin deacetylase (PgdA/CDA1 family)
VKRDQGRLREIVSCGHEVAVHCYRHRSYLRLAHWQVVQDMRRVKGVIEEAVGCTPQLFRPPYGQFSLSCWLEAERQGWRPILWTRDSRDWDATNTPRSIADRVGWPVGGDIILMHDSDRYASPYSWRNTLGALPIILERTYSAGLAVCSVGSLLDAK